MSRIAEKLAAEYANPEERQRAAVITRKLSAADELNARA